MSKQTKIHVPVGILYRWMYPTVNPYSCGVEVCSLAYPWEGSHPFLTRITHECGREIAWKPGEGHEARGKTFLLVTPSLLQDAEKVRRRKKTVIWSIWFVSFVWLNKTN